MAAFRKIIVGAVASLAFASNALAWEQMGGQAPSGEGGMRALPGGGLMLKDVPAQGGNVANLPGVNLNRQLNANKPGNCSSRDVNYFEGNQFRSGTMNECKFGNFSISTMGAQPSQNYEPPPLFGQGPPPGSGGWARN